MRPCVQDTVLESDLLCTKKIARSGDGKEYRKLQMNRSESRPGKYCTSYIFPQMSISTGGLGPTHVEPVERCPAIPSIEVSDLSMM